MIVIIYSPEYLAREAALRKERDRKVQERLELFFEEVEAAVDEVFSEEEDQTEEES